MNWLRRLRFRWPVYVVPEGPRMWLGYDSFPLGRRMIRRSTKASYGDPSSPNENTTNP